MTDAVHEVLPAQLEVGLEGLGLLRSYPFLGAAEAGARLAELRLLAEQGEQRELEVMQVGAGYASWATTYDTRVNQLLMAEQPTIEAVLDGVPAGVALDAACGTGRLTTLLLARGHRVTALDASAEMLAAARRTVPGAAYRQGSITALPFPDRSFDLVTCGLALTHLDAVRPAVAEQARVVRPGGRVVISDVHPVAVSLGGHAYFRTLDGARRVIANHVHWHGEYLAAFAAHGLRVRRCLEPRYTPEIVDSFVREGSTPSNRHLLGLPFALVWDLEWSGDAVVPPP